MNVELMNAVMKYCFRCSEDLTHYRDSKLWWCPRCALVCTKFEYSGGKNELRMVWKEDFTAMGDDG